MTKTLSVTIEIPNQSAIKYEYNRATKQLEVDRILVGDFRYPANYGFVAEALDYDGDELDVLVYSPHAFVPGAIVKARLLGAMKMIDDGETDTKLIAVHANDEALKHIQTMADLPGEWLNSVEVFFNTYKNYKRANIVQITGFENVAYAIEEYEACVKLMQQYGKLDKAAFITKMKALHPEKYLLNK